MPIGQSLLYCFPPLPIQLSPTPFREPAQPPQPLIHGVVKLPPPAVRHVTRVNQLFLHVPVAIIVPVTLPRLPPQVVNGVQLGRVRPDQPVLHPLFQRRVRPEILQEVHPPRQPVPPHEHLVKEPLVPSVVRNDVVSEAHQRAERAVRRLDHHDPRVEDSLVVPRGRDLREVEEDVEVSEYDDVGVDEDDLVVVGELPQAELAVVVLVVAPFLGFRVSDSGYDSDLPARGGEGVAFWGGDGVVYEEDKVASGACLDEALCERYCAANVGF